MIDFLIKSTLSLIILYGVYIALLEREKMHLFNRFFLLFSLVFSLGIPFITFEIYVESTAIVSQNTIQAMPFTAVIVEEESDYLPMILWSFYALITAILATRFLINLIKIKRKITSNASEKIKNATLILLNEKVLPHTFLNYIFINKDDYENRKIEDELYTHEHTHANQKHTFDILFIELLKTIFWFNPLFISYKRAIQLNHEFLADEKVVTSYNNVPFYQTLLVEKASWNNTFYLASNLNYLVTKKRLIMMTKTTSTTTKFFKKVIVAPLFLGMFIFGSSTTFAQELPIPTVQKDSKIEKDFYENIDVDVKPDFPGGMKEFYNFVGKNYRVPETKKLNGKVMVEFIVEKDGSLSNFKILHDLGKDTGKEAIRVLKKSPKWIPGQHKGKEVRVKYLIPISIVS